MVRISVIILATFGVAHADRASRRVVVGIAPELLYITDADATIPVPALRVGFAATAHVSLEASAGYVPMSYDAHAAIASAGAKYALWTSKGTPYAMARLGLYDSKPDEGDAATYPFAAVGAGLEYTGSNGLTAWIELGPGLASYDDDIRLCVFGAVGVGYRLR